MLESIFYVSGVFIFLVNLWYFLHIKKIDYYTEWYVAYKKIMQKEPKVINELIESDRDFLSNYMLAMIITGIWLILGCFTANIWWFMACIIINYSANHLLKVSGLLDKKFIRFTLEILFYLIKLFIIFTILNSHFNLIS